ncbi:hypothetical protein MAPG_00202 [Magnaporthiopsis poae ATCC 64411]|uniref:CENP-V/GFA domain-containing protein n=1 Tax=Magnaporthiopsis poae (strain ATCC 64411 / 73-15) TaxID=644358 RepID=A0A0C4DKD4_MAGP6|nr:hypothetical protein MAPG_00202 [Magnaporthiopsis poae ATCC 64411]
MSDDDWKTSAPYSIGGPPDGATVYWTGSCHCGRIEYSLTRDKPLQSKYCHCSDCRVLHGAPFQWAAIFHKSDIHFTHGAQGLGWYHTSTKSPEHHLPCKVYCAFCRTPIMDEGRNMVLLFPTLINGLDERAREAFKPQSHLFYPQRVVDFAGDGVTKWSGLNDQSDELGEDGRPKGA